MYPFPVAGFLMRHLSVSPPVAGRRNVPSVAIGSYTSGVPARSRSSVVMPVDGSSVVPSDSASIAHSRRQYAWWWWALQVQLLVVAPKPKIGSIVPSDVEAPLHDVPVPTRVRLGHEPEGVALIVDRDPLEVPRIATALAQTWTAAHSRHLDARSARRHVRSVGLKQSSE